MSFSIHNIISNKIYKMEKDYETYSQFINRYEQDSPSDGQFDGGFDLRETLQYFFKKQGDNNTIFTEEISQKQSKGPQRQEKSEQTELNPTLLQTQPLIHVHSQQTSLQLHQSSPSPPPPKSHSKPNLHLKKGSRKRKMKNQYDKNMFSHITHVIINKMLTRPYYEEIAAYCDMHNVKVMDYLSFFKKFDLTIGWGISEFLSFLDKSTIQSGIRKVFTYFFVRYLKEDYPAYVLTEGRMHHKLKYLQYGVRMLYIPKLDRSDYQKIFSKRQTN